MPDFVAGTRTPPSMIAGIRGPEQLNQSRVVVDMQDEILLYMPSAAPLTVLTGKLRKKRQAHNYKFEFLEKDEAPRQLVLSADSLVSDTTLDVNTGQGARVAKYDMLLNLRTREISIATATPAADQITVVRAIGGGEADMLTGDSLVKIGNSYPDGSDIGDLKSVQEANLFNYCQILRKPFGFTGRDIVTELYGGSDRMNETKWMSIEHLKDLEYCYFFGKRASRTGDNNHIQSFTGGLEFFIQSNVWDVTNVTLTHRAFVDFLEDAMRWGRGGYLNGSSTKYLFHSARWGTEINMWAADKIEHRPLDKVGGLALNEWVTTHGRVMLIHDPILDEWHQDMAFLLDLNHLRYAAMKNRDTKLLDNREGNAIDGEEFEYFTDFGAQVEQETAHAILKGLK